MRAWLGRSDPPFLPSRQRHPAESAWLPSLRAERPFPKFGPNTLSREIWSFPGCGRAELTPARSACSSRPAQHPSPRPNSGASPWPGSSHPGSSRGQDPLRGEGRAVSGARCAGGLRRNGAAVGGSWRPAVPLRCHVGGCRRSGVALLSPSLPAAGPSPRRSRGLAAPRGSPRSGRSPGRLLLGAPSPRSPPRESGGVWVRGQPGRQSGMKDDFLNCISVRGLSGLMS